MTVLEPPRKSVSYDPDSRGTAILVGLLFLVATLAFILGDSLVTGVFEDDAAALDTRRLAVGVGLMAICGVAVAVIGIAMLAVLRPFHAGLAWGYMTFRVLECAVIFAVGGYMLATEEIVSYEAAIYLFTGIGGLLLAFALLRSGLIAPWLARLGIAGYIAITLAVPSDLLDIATLDSPGGVLLYVPGAVFEIVLPIVLIARGFRRVDASAAAPSQTPA